MKMIRTSILCGTVTLLALGCGSAGEEGPPTEVQVLTDSLGTELSPVSREVVLSNEVAERELNLILRVQTRPGSLFEVYEPSPGVMIYSGGGSRETSVATSARPESAVDAAAVEAALAGVTPGGASVKAQPGAAFGSGTLVEVLARIAPRSLDLPEVEAAVQRQRERIEALGREVSGPSLADARKAVREVLGVAAERTAVEQTGVPEGLAGPVYTRAGGFTGGYCDEEYFTEEWPGYPIAAPPSICPFNYFDEDECLTNFQGGTSSENNQDATWALTNVCSAKGTVKLSVKWGNDESNWTVGENFWRWFKATDSGCGGWLDDCPYFRSEVKEASGDRYHWRYFVNTN